jgi:hypothetical protein
MSPSHVFHYASQNIPARTHTHTHKFTQTAHTNDDGISASIIRMIIAVWTTQIVQNTVVWAATMHNVNIYSDVSETINASNSIC